MHINTIYGSLNTPGVGRLTVELCRHRRPWEQINPHKIPARHLCFVPTHTLSDEATSDLSSAEWPTELVLVSNEKDRDVFLNQEQIHTILAPGIRGTYHLTHAPTHFFLASSTTWNETMSLTATHPTRPVPIRPATYAPTTPMGPITPPRRRFNEVTSRRPPSLGHTPPYTLPSIYLNIAELCEGLAVGRKAF